MVSLPVYDHTVSAAGYFVKCVLQVSYDIYRIMQTWLLTAAKKNTCYAHGVQDYMKNKYTDGKADACIL